MAHNLRDSRRPGGRFWDSDADYSPDNDDLVEDMEQDNDDSDEDSQDAGVDDDEDEYHDAESENVEVELILQPGGPGQGQARATSLTPRQILAIFRGADLRGVLLGEYDNDDDDEAYSSLYGRRRRSPPDPNRFPKIPSDKGTELMDSGVFGTSDIQRYNHKKIARRLLDRELGLGDYASQKVNQNLVRQRLVPSNAADMIINYDEAAYSGQFSDDGNFFFAVVKDFHVRMYDTSNPYNWRHYKTVRYPGGQWTLSDASLSPDNKWLAYTSLCSNVSLAPTDPYDTGDPYFLDLGTGPDRRRRNFAIYSVRFSGDGRELVAGTNLNSLVIYDIESRQVLNHVYGHEDDVNAVCFADKSSPHILYSGSDDSTIKVWDRRSMADQRPAGAFVGHIEGLTYIDSKGDGRYILSNSKDQTMKLWDLRMAMSSEQFREKNPTRYAGNSNFDYRWGDYDDDDWFPHPDDNSVVTFRGHRVLQTLIRCHFSPPGSTNSRYVYSGSYDGKVYIWNMDATLASTIDVQKATYNTRPRWSGHFHGGGGWKTCVRDASWHPHAPMVVASALNGWNQFHGTCSIHSYNEAPTDEAEPKMGLRVNDVLAQDPSFYGRGSFSASYDADN